MNSLRGFCAFFALFISIGVFGKESFQGTSALMNNKTIEGVVAVVVPGGQKK
jgi:hypothetical protein